MKTLISFCGLAVSLALAGEAPAVPANVTVDFIKTLKSDDAKKVSVTDIDTPSFNKPGKLAFDVPFVNKLSIEASAIIQILTQINIDAKADALRFHVKFRSISAAPGSAKEEEHYFFSNAKIEADAPKDALLIVTLVEAGTFKEITSFDVASVLRSSLKDGKLDIVASNSVLCANDDPSQAVRKQLRVEYAIGNASFQTTVQEGQRLKLPRRGAPFGDVSIVSAFYEAPKPK